MNQEIVPETITEVNSSAEVVRQLLSKSSLNGPVGGTVTPQGCTLSECITTPDEVEELLRLELLRREARGEDLSQLRSVRVSVPRPTHRDSLTGIFKEGHLGKKPVKISLQMLPLYVIAARRPEEALYGKAREELDLAVRRRNVKPEGVRRCKSKPLDLVRVFNTFNSPRLRCYRKMILVALRNYWSWDQLRTVPAYIIACRGFPREDISQTRVLLSADFRDRRALDTLLGIIYPEGNVPSTSTYTRTMDAVTLAAQSIGGSSGEIASFFLMVNSMSNHLKLCAEKLACFQSAAFLQLFIARTPLELSSAFVILSQHPLFKDKLPDDFVHLAHAGVIGLEFVGKVTGGFGKVTPEAHFVGPERDNVFAKFQHSPLVQKAGVLTAAMTAGLFVDSFPMGIRMVLEDFNKGTRTIDSFMTVAETAMDFLGYFWERLAVAIEKNDPFELLGRNLERELIDDMAAWQMQVQKYRLQPAGRTPQEIIEAGKKLLERSKKFDTRDILHLSYRTRLDAQLRALEIAQHDRITPAVGLFFFGPPGIGKTYAMVEIEAMIRVMENLPKKTPIVMEVQNVKHQHMPTLPLILSFNDYLQAKDEYGTVSTLSMLQSVVDSVTPRFETASLEEKANSYAAPIVVVVSTNTKTFNLSQAVSGANKLNRRYKIVQFSYTDAAYEIAQDEDVDIGKVLELHPNRRDLVKYTWGDANFADGNVLDFGRIRNPVSSHNFEELIQYIYELIKARSRREEPEATMIIENGRIRRRDADSEPRPDPNIRDSMMIPGYVPQGSAPSIPLATDLEEEEEEQHPNPHYAGLRFRLVGGLVFHTPIWYGEKIAIPLRYKKDVSYIVTETDGLLVLEPAPDGTLCLRYRFRKDDNCLVVTHVYYGAYHDPDHVVMAQRVTAQSRAAFDRLDEWAQQDVSPLFMKTVCVGKSRYPAWLVALFGITACSAAAGIAALIVGWRRRRAEATLAPGLNNVPYERVPVPPTPHMEMIWAGAPLKQFTGEIRRSDGTCSMHALVILADLLAVAGHFFRGATGYFKPMCPGETYEVRLGNHWQKFTYVPTQVVYRGEDLAFVRPPNLNGVVSQSYTTTQQCRFNGNRECRFKGELLVSDGMYGKFADSQAGDCGLPYFVGDTVVGIHVGATTHSSGDKWVVMEPLTRDLIDSARKELESRGLLTPVIAEGIAEPMRKYLSVLEPGYHPKSGASYIKERMEATSHLVIGHFKFADVQKMSGKPSPGAPYFPEVPLYSQPHTRAQASAGYNCPLLTRVVAMESQTGIHEEDWRLAMEDWLRLAPRPNMKLSPLTLHQVLCGDVDSHLIKPKDLTKALGPTLSKGFNLSKSQSFVLDGDKYTASPAVLEEYHRLERLIRAGEVPATFASATMKDELLPDEKVKKGKGRYFFVNDLAANMLMRKYCLPLMVTLLNAPLVSEIIGVINPGSEQWGALKKHLTKFGDDRLVDSDQTSFDSKHDRTLRDVCTLMMRYAIECGYSAQDARCVYLVMRMMGRYILFMEGILYVCSRGLTSGRSDTLVVNSIINKLLMYYSYHRACSDKRCVREPVENHIVMACTGDDNVMGLSLNSPLTPDLIPTFQAEFGYVVTDASKATLPYFKRIEEVGFLKRRFVTKGDRVYAPLELNSILKSMAYEVGKFTPETSVKRLGEASQSAIRELFMHDEVTEKEYRARLEKLVSDFSLPALPSRPQLDADYAAHVFTPWDTSGYELPKQTETERLRLAEVMDRNKGGSLNPVLNCWNITPGEFAIRPEGIPTLIQAIHEPSGLEEPSEVYSSANNNLDQSPVAGTTNTLNLNEAGVASGEAATSGITALNVGELGVLNLGNATPSVVHPERGLSFVEQLARDRFLTAYPASASTSPVPIGGTFFANPQVISITRPYRAYRGDFVVTLVVTGSSALYGIERFSFVPFPGSDNYRYTTHGGDVIPNLMCGALPHVDIDYSQPKSYEIRLPYINSVPMRAKNGRTWEMQTEILSPLSSAYGMTVPNLNVEVWCRLENAEFFIPVIPEGKGDAVPTAPLSRMMQMGSAIAAKSPIPYADVIAKALGVGGKFAEMLGYSRPPVAPDSIMVVRHNADASLMSGQPDFSRCLGSIPGQGRNVATAAYPSCSENDDNLADMMSVPCVVRTSWPANTHQDVHPFVCEPFGSVAPVAIKPTPLGHTATAFTWWRGTINVRVVFPSSTLVRARVGINVYPPGQTSSAFVGDGSILAYTLDVVGTSEIVIEVPWLYFSYWNPTIDFQSSDTSNSGYARIKWFMLEGPLGPSPTPVALNPYVEIMAGSDFEVAVPTTTYLNRYYFGVDAEVIPEGLAEAFFGETIPNVRYLSKRACRLIDRGDGYTLAADGEYPTDAVVSYFTFDTWFRPCFMGYTGSSVIRLELNDDNSTPIIATQNRANAGLQDPGGGSGSAIISSVLTDCLEVRTVDRAITLFKNPRWNAGSQNVEGFEGLKVTNGHGTKWWQSSGDDRKYINYLGPTRVWRRT